MIPRINKITTQSADSLQRAQDDLSSLIQKYTANYTKDLIWNPEVELIWLQEPTLAESLKPGKALKRLKEGDKWLIPKETLAKIKTSAYVVVGEKLFFVEKARNKITPIKISKDDLMNLRNHSEWSMIESLNSITEFTGHAIDSMPVRKIESMDPVQVRLSKHALLALKESEELIRNLGELSTEIAQYAGVSQAEELNPDAEQNLSAAEKKVLIEQLAQKFDDMESKPTDPEEVYKIDENEPDNRFVAAGKKVIEVGKAGTRFAKEGGTMVVNSVPVLNTGLQLLKPLKSSIILSIAASLDETSALYQGFVNYSWYADIAIATGRFVSSMRTAAIEKQDSILRPLFALSAHCAQIYKIAEEANLPQQMKDELRSMHTTLAGLQAKIIVESKDSTQFDKTIMEDVRNKMTNLITTYFTNKNNPLEVLESNQALLEDIGNKMPNLITTYLTQNNQLVALDPTQQQPIMPSVSTPMSEHLHSFAKQLKHDTAHLHHDIDFKEAIDRLEASLKQQDAEGFYIVLSHAEETVTSLNLKSIANTFLALEKLSKYYSGDGSEVSRLKALQYGKKALENFSKINWNDVNVHATDADKNVINAMLSQGMATIGLELKKLVDSSHQIELENHLRYGSILEELNPLFESVDKVFHDRGLTIPGNPFGFDVARDEKINSTTQFSCVGNARSRKSTCC